MTKPIGYTPQMLEWLEANQAGISRKELTDRLNAKFGTEIKCGSIKNLCARNKWISGISGNFTKGSEPWNKGVTGYMGANSTSFKKGMVSRNKRPLGSERMCSKDGYTLVKVAEPRTWKGKHIVVWESVNGKLPKGHCIKFLDNDRTNCDIGNLLAIDRAVHVRLNQSNPADSKNPDINHAIILTEQLKHTVKNIHKIRGGI